MVEQFDAQQHAGLLETPGDADILRARRELAAGVVVRDDDARGAVRDGVGEDLPGVDERLVEGTDGDDALFDKVRRPVEGQDEKILLLFSAYSRSRPDTSAADAILTFPRTR